MDIYEQVKDFIGVQFETDGGNISLDTTLDELGADSLDLIDLISDIENEYEIEIPNEVVSKIKNVGELVAVIEEKV